MSSTINRRHFALLLALGGMAGCTSTQPQEPSLLIIDRLPTDFGRPIKLLGPDEHKEEQQALLTAIEEQIHGKFTITAQRILLLHTPLNESPIISPILKMDFHNAINEINKDHELIFTNSTLDDPYINIWETGDSTKEYTALSVFWPRNKDNNDELIGYFQLKPVK